MAHWYNFENLSQNGFIQAGQVYPIVPTVIVPNFSMSYFEEFKFKLSQLSPIDGRIGISWNATSIDSGLFSWKFEVVIMSLLSILKYKVNRAYECYQNEPN